MPSETLRGAYVAIVTPFRGTAVDEPCFTRLVEAIGRVGPLGILVAGTTGEAAHLTVAEIATLVRRAVAARGAHARPVMAGLRAATPEAVAAGCAAVATVGAEYLLLCAPPGTDADAAEAWLTTAIPRSTLPVLVYENPNTGSPRLGVERLRRLSVLPQVIGHKDSTGDRPAAEALAAGAFIGSAQLALGLGTKARGSITALANLFPRTALALLTGEAPRIDAWTAGIAFVKAHGIAGIKAALQISGFGAAQLRADPAVPSAAAFNAAAALIEEHPLEMTA